MKRILTSPFDIVAKALEISRDEITENSAMGETPNWDSLNHVVLIGELESSYGIEIPNEDIEKYVTMKSIIQIYKEKSGDVTSLEKLKNVLKKIPVLKIFIK